MFTGWPVEVTMPDLADIDPVWSSPTITAARIELERLRAQQRAVLDLCGYLERVSPNMLIEVSIVRECVETGQVPDLVKRYQ
jgi:hypothetical protein